MTEPPPEPHPADTDGQRKPTDADRETIRRLFAALDDIPTRYVNDDPEVPTWEEGGRIGNAPPVDQPGIPPMTPRETQIGRVALYSGAGVSLPILSAAVFMVATEHANPDVIAWCAGGISALALLVAAFGYVIKRVVAAVPPPPPVIHNHIDGDLYQEQHEIHSHSNGLIVNSNNEQ